VRHGTELSDCKEQIFFFFLICVLSSTLQSLSTTKALKQSRRKYENMTDEPNLSQISLDHYKTTKD